MGLSGSSAGKHAQLVLFEMPLALSNRPVNIMECELCRYLAQRCNETWDFGELVVVCFEVTSSFVKKARALEKHFLKRMFGKSIFWPHLQLVVFLSISEH